MATLATTLLSQLRAACESADPEWFEESIPFVQAALSEAIRDGRSFEIYLEFLTVFSQIGEAQESLGRGEAERSREHLDRAQEALEEMEALLDERERPPSSAFPVLHELAGGLLASEAQLNAAWDYLSSVHQRLENIVPLAGERQSWEFSMILVKDALLRLEDCVEHFEGRPREESQQLLQEGCGSLLEALARVEAGGGGSGALPREVETLLQIAESYLHGQVPGSHLLRALEPFEQRVRGAPTGHPLVRTFQFTLGQVREAVEAGSETYLREALRDFIQVVEELIQR